MPKHLIALNIDSINSLAFKTQGDVVTGLILDVTVNYDELGITRTVDVWPSLTATQREQVQLLYTRLCNLAAQTYVE